MDIRLQLPHWSSIVHGTKANSSATHNLEYRIPIASLNVFDTVAVLVLIPVFDNWLYPHLRRRGFPLTMLAKIGWGFLLAG